MAPNGHIERACRPLREQSGHPHPTASYPLLTGLTIVALQHSSHKPTKACGRRHRAVRLSAPGAVPHDVAHQVAHVVLQISDDVLDDISDRDHAHDLARVQHW